MKHSRLLKALIVATIATACMGLLAACSSQGESESAIAASGNGISITEDEVTEIIESNRAAYGLEDEETWAQALIDADLTPASYREQVINSLVDDQLVSNGAEELGITVEESEVDEHVASIRADLNLADDDEGWADALERAGFTEQEYRESITKQLLAQAVTQYFTDKVELTDDELLESVNDYAMYYDGAKRSSHILFGVDDVEDADAMAKAREEAQAVLDQINDGADFAELAKEHSTDTGSAENGGDVGWDVLSSFVTEYTDALDGLDKDQVSGLVESQYGIHIIKVTDVFTAPEKVKKLSQIPDEILETITSMAKQIKSNEDYQAWLDEEREKAEVVINDMPEDVPYNVDLSQYQTDEESDEEATADGEDLDGDGEVDEDGDEVIEVEADEDGVIDLDSDDIEIVEDDEDLEDEDTEVIDVEEEEETEAK